jgi:DNA-binding XRE family transcriptional regulator
VWISGAGGAKGEGNGDGEWFGALLRAHRSAAGLTQRELATLADVSVGTLRDLEQGRTRHPRTGSAVRLWRSLFSCPHYV